MAENKDDIIELIDENGNKQKFEISATFHVEDIEYAVLFPENEEDEEAYLLRIVYDEEGNVLFESIEDQDEFNEAIAVYEGIVDEII